ncbi:hypothetical protein J3459_017916 [Metarhizium acridum]|uniref:Phosphatidylglycerol lysyltransferase C-terminal domain-containing protein n=1 Tax=Metarhizium acridum (strain CQMa 102) TaxID=655827 RepID=E9E762_METAQ|nr:uncharacterized protein MAC_05710 [Metarhizium acridum CQMa 102]EFY88237.1 hypothetical protein MAC_05710 [Metarhizium acridum CQMa 102]KAG8408311.1 hypothetical protein J3459_017916 [Metarhizium acridum]KAG8411099.1 hypothetical protein J3458_016209 [Metarhizium acridum]
MDRYVLRRPRTHASATEANAPCCQRLFTKPNNHTPLIHRIAKSYELEFPSHQKTTDHIGDATRSKSRWQALGGGNENHSFGGTLVATTVNRIPDETYDEYSRTFHMVLLDPSYQVYTSPTGHGSVMYKIENETMVVVGDPMCGKDDLGSLLEEIEKFRNLRHPTKLKLAFMGVGQSFIQYADTKGWDYIEFGSERVVNPMRNAVLENQAGKRMLTQCQHLLDPKQGLKMGFYAPSISGINSHLEQQLEQLYDDWRDAKGAKKSGDAQAFITAYDIFSYRRKTAFLYISDSEGEIAGMAMLRQLGAESGFYVDPCIASGSAPKGVTELLMVSGMRLLRRAEIPYLSLGVEPFADLATRGFLARAARSLYKIFTDRASVTGKKAYNDKFRPDPVLESSLYVVFPKGKKKALLPNFPIREAWAIMQVAHIQADDGLKKPACPQHPHIPAANDLAHEEREGVPRRFWDKALVV